MEKRLRLANALEKELDSLRGDSVIKGSKLAIEFLRTGKMPDQELIEYYEMLQAVIEDFECICSDYGIRGDT